jgi:hypothetical protein
MTPTAPTPPFTQARRTRRASGVASVGSGSAALLGYSLAGLAMLGACKAKLPGECRSDGDCSAGAVFSARILREG